MKLAGLLTIVAMMFIADSYAVQVWNQKANFGGVARHRTTSFTIGNKGYMGLGHYNSGPSGNIHLEDFWEYDPASNTWTQKADFGGGPRYHAVGVGYGSKAYVGTGRSIGGILNTDWWQFDPIANTWSVLPAFPGNPCRGAVAFLLEDLIFVGTGQTTSGFTSAFYAYDITNNQWLGGVSTFPGSPRTSAVAFTIDDKAYVGTGGTGCGTTDFYEYKLSNNTWVQRANVGTMIRQEAVGFTVNGKGYIGTGDNCSSGTNYKDMWEYDPATDTWIEIEEFAGSARRYLSSFVIGNKVFCGLGTSGVNYADLWEFDQTLSVISTDQSSLEVNSYPNPVVENVSFTLNHLPAGVEFEDLSLTIHSISGQRLFEEQFHSNSVTFNRSTERAGLYFYSINYEGQRVRTGKLIFR